MSSPPDQPSAYPYPNPQSSGGYGHPGPPPAGVPGQHNPYAQPQPQQGQPQQQPSQGQPTQPGYPNPYAQGGYYGSGIPGPPPGGTGGGGGKKGLLWGVVGAVVASALWGGTILVFGTGGGGGSGGDDLGSYVFQKNLCTNLDLTSFKTKYPDSDTFSHEALGHEDTDTMECNLGLEKSGSTFSDAYLTVSLAFHKKSDPGPDFTSTWETYAQRSGDYTVKKLSGFGDQSYLVSQFPSSATSPHEAFLAVRDGSVTYTMEWSAFLTTGDEDDLPTLSEVTSMLETDTRATLPKLQS